MSSASLNRINRTCFSGTLYSKFIFSPNGDGINDLFVISGIDAFPDHRLIVYNRWEQKVYETKNYQNDWDGAPNMSYGDNSKLLPEGVYFYFFEESEGGKLHKGFIYIKR